MTLPNTNFYARRQLLPSIKLASFHVKFAMNHSKNNLGIIFYTIKFHNFNHIQNFIRFITVIFRFFEHLKKHYEPGGTGVGTTLASTPAQKTLEHTQGERVVDQAENDRQESLLSSLLNLSCIECNKTFRRQKTFEAHMRDIHSNKNEPLDEFSEPEDLMEGRNMFLYLRIQYPIKLLKWTFFK